MPVMGGERGATIISIRSRIKAKREFTAQKEELQQALLQITLQERNERLEGAKSLERLGSPMAFKPALVAAEKEADDEVRYHLIKALNSISTPDFRRPGDTVPRLESMIRGERCGKVVWEAALALHYFSYDKADAMERLVALEGDIRRRYIALEVKEPVVLAISGAIADIASIDTRWAALALYY